MKNKRNKRKINNYKTLEKKYIFRRYRVRPFVQVSKENTRKPYVKTPFTVREERKKAKAQITPTCFQIALVKVPWYRKFAKSFFGILGFYYN